MAHSMDNARSEWYFLHFKQTFIVAYTANCEVKYLKIKRKLLL